MCEQSRAASGAKVTQPRQTPCAERFGAGGDCCGPASELSRCTSEVVGRRSGSYTYMGTDATTCGVALCSLGSWPWISASVAVPPDTTGAFAIEFVGTQRWFFAPTFGSEVWVWPNLPRGHHILVLRHCPAIGERVRTPGIINRTKAHACRRTPRIKRCCAGMTTAEPAGAIGWYSHVCLHRALSLSVYLRRVARVEQNLAPLIEFIYCILTL